MAEEIKSQCSFRGCHHGPEKDVVDMFKAPDAHQYNPIQVQHKLAYHRKYMRDQDNRHPSGCFHMDLNQNPVAERASCGGFLPRMCTHGCLRSLVKGRTFTKRELLYPAGVPQDGGWFRDLVDGWSYNEVPLCSARDIHSRWHESVQKQRSTWYAVYIGLLCTCVLSCR